jgi:hypothetical protein
MTARAKGIYSTLWLVVLVLAIVVANSDRAYRLEIQGIL